MAARIVITSPYQQFADMARELAREFRLDIIVVEEVLENAAEEVARICRRQEIEVIVSRGGTAVAISQAVDVPVITAEANDFDVLLAFWDARKVTDRIGFLAFNYPGQQYDFSNLTEIIGVEVGQYLFERVEDIPKQIRRAQEDGVMAIASGSSFAVDTARKMGLEAFLVQAGRRTVVQALQQAKWVLDVRDQDKKSAKQLQTILDLSSDGIIAVDESDIIKVFNPAAERILGISRSQLAGRSLSGSPEFRELARLFAPKGEAHGEVVRVGESSLLLNRALLHVGGKKTGTVVTIQEIDKLQKLEQDVRMQLHSRGLVARYQFSDILGASEAIRLCTEKAEKFAGTDATILIVGESGTGKELLAQSIHNSSARKDGPFVAVNCAALPETLLESELFGYEEGAFTGAKKGGKAGFFELAHGGTIFLDEIGTLPKNVQQRLLRVLQEREVFRLGGNKVVPVDVRVIAATNEDLQAAIDRNDFRSDLYYRLSVLNIYVPPLRERADDIRILVGDLLREFSRKYHKSVNGISEQLMEWLRTYHWPGNIRELRNTIEQMVVMAVGNTLEMHHLQIPPRMQQSEKRKKSEGDNGITVSPGTLAEMEEEIIKIYLQRFQWEKSRTAEELGINRTTLWKKLKKMGIE